ncbi:MAG: Uma2 family endonuclease, partial [Myxococcales bacterium]
MAPHAEALVSLAESLRGPFHHGRGGPGGWRIVPEVDVRVRGDIVSPDLAGWRRERMPAIPDE